MTSFEESRKHKRVDIIFKVDYDSREEFLADYASNVSGGGLFIATTKPFQIGDEISFNISLPGLLAPVLCRGEVRWCRPPQSADQDNPAGIGVAFRFKDEQEAEQMQVLMEKLARDPETIEPAELPVAPAEPYRVLLAEDNKMVRGMFLFAVKKFHGVRLAGQRELVVVEAEDGNQAWKHFRKEPFDLAIIDYYMPVMDGMEVIRRIRESETERSMPIIVISAGGEDAQKAAYEAGADFFLGKPVMLAQLFKSLQLLLSLEEQL